MMDQTERDRQRGQALKQRLEAVTSRLRTVAGSSPGDSGPNLRSVHTQFHCSTGRLALEVRRCETLAKCLKEHRQP